jgi:hypothetical protein
MSILSRLRQGYGGGPPLEEEGTQWWAYPKKTSKGFNTFFGLDLIRGDSLNPRHPRSKTLIFCIVFIQ